MTRGIKSLDCELGWDAAKGLEDVVGVQFGQATDWELRIEFQIDQGRSVDVIFDRPVSFRVQDEGEILDYWFVRDKEGVPPSSTFYSIDESEFLTEIRRGVTGLHGPLRHILVGDRDLCVEVICQSLPRIVHRS